MTAISEFDRFLDPSVDVAWRHEGFILHRADIDLEHKISPGQALALLLLGETGSVATASAYLGALGSQTVDALQHVLTRFPTYLRGQQSRSFDPGWWGSKLPFARRHKTAVYAAPASVTWLVTLECNRRCPYCFYKIIPVGGSRQRPSDAMAPTEAIRLINELADLGTADLYLTGGEPLLHPDITIYVGAAARRGIRCHIVSKFALDSDLAMELRQAGLYRLTLSIDDLRGDIATRLTGARNFVDESTQGLKHALDAGLNVDVNTVVTKLNADGIPDLARKLEGLGCASLTLNPVQEPFFRNANASRMVLSNEGNFFAQCVLRARYSVDGRMESRTSNKPSPSGRSSS